MPTAVAESIELRVVVRGECLCGTPYPIGDRPGDCRHDVVSTWGEIEYPAARPDRGEVGHLILAPRGWVDSMARGGYGVSNACAGSTWAASTKRDKGSPTRRFLHLAYDGRGWTWEMFRAHWDDNRGPDLYIGRWPD